MGSPGAAQADYKVGSKVILAKGWEAVADAASGCLKPGDVGEIIESDGTERPYNTRFCGVTVCCTLPAWDSLSYVALRVQVVTEAPLIRRLGRLRSIGIGGKLSACRAQLMPPRLRVPRPSLLAHWWS